MPRQDGKPTFRLTEVLGPKSQIMFAIISLYSTSVSWIYEFFDPCTPVIMVAQPDSSGQARIKNFLPNWVMTVPFLRNGHGCQHMKAVWLQGIPPRPQPGPHDPKITDDFPSIMQHVLRAVNVRDALTNMLAHEHPNLPLQLIGDLCSKWDWSKVKVKLIPSIAGKHEGWPRVVQSGHPRLIKALRDFGLRTGKGKAAKEPAIECQGSSIGTYSTRWLNEFYYSTRGESAEDWLPTSANLANQWEGTRFPRELFYDSNSAGGKVLMHTKMIIATFRPRSTPFSVPSSSKKPPAATSFKGKGKSNAVPITISDSKTESESEDDSGGVDASPKEPIGWAYVGSHNFTPSAWGTLSGSRHRVDYVALVPQNVSHELGILFPLYNEKEVERVSCFRRPPRKDKTTLTMKTGNHASASVSATGLPLSNFCFIALTANTSGIEYRAGKGGRSPGNKHSLDILPELSQSLGKAATLTADDEKHKYLSKDKQENLSQRRWVAKIHIWRHECIPDLSGSYGTRRKVTFPARLVVPTPQSPKSGSREGRQEQNGVVGALVVYNLFTLVTLDSNTPLSLQKDCLIENHAMYIRRLVSGSKARLKDDELGTDLVLSILLRFSLLDEPNHCRGFSATGLESIYRNRRADVQRFLSARHGQDFWVFNFCPTTENSYDESVFDGRRPTVPIHVVGHERDASVAFRFRYQSSGVALTPTIHAQTAGKGRSGTLACAYLLSCPLSPAPPELDTRLTLRIADFIRNVDTAKPTSSTFEDAEVETMQATTDSWSQKESDLTRDWTMVRTVSEPPRDRIEQVLDLYTTRRMKPTVRQLPLRTPKLGVSIPNEQRWACHPTQKEVWDYANVAAGRSKSRVQRTQLRGNSGGRAWASLTRYDDDLVGQLSELSPCQTPEAPRTFKDGHWVREKIMSTATVEVSWNGSMSVVHPSPSDTRVQVDPIMHPHQTITAVFITDVRQRCPGLFISSLRQHLPQRMRMGNSLVDLNISMVRCTHWSAGRFKVAVSDDRCVLYWFHLTARDDVFGCHTIAMLSMAVFLYLPHIIGANTPKRSRDVSVFGIRPCPIQFIVQLGLGYRST
ncbi:hypothetical protein EDC04DRAFT_2605178 [Pisolithus marmoratus]|nr:hypothetical protein EDC04DRAFT_2605178 [Pisolithus marmoratus]